MEFPAIVSDASPGLQIIQVDGDRRPVNCAAYSCKGSISREGALFPAFDVGVSYFLEFDVINLRSEFARQ